MIGRKYLHPHNSGFTLLELLLAISVMAALFVGLAAVFQNWASATVDRNVSREVQQLQDAATNYVRLNIDQIIATQIPTVNDTAEISFADLIANGFLSSNDITFNSYKQPMRTVIRYASDTAINGDVIEVLTFSEGPKIANKRLLNAASNGQKSVGIISNLNISPTCCNGNAQSLNGSWSTELSNYTVITSPDATGGYMAAYDLISVNNQISNNFLFKNAVSGAPELNRMETNLDLNNFDIVNAGFIVADHMKVAGDAIFSGQQSDLSPTPYVLSVRDDFNTNSNFTIADGGDENKGSASIAGDGTIGADFIVSGTLDIANGNAALGNVTAGRIQTTNITIGGLSQIGDLDANDADVTFNNVLSTVAEFDDRISTRTLQAQNINNIESATVDSLISSEVTVTSNAVNISPELRVVEDVLVTGDFNPSSLAATGKVNISNMIRCNQGCP